MRTPQVTVTFDKRKKHIKNELLRMKKEDNINISAYVTDLIEKDIGVYYPHR